jgi:HAMP domain-containing protein
MRNGKQMYVVKCDACEAKYRIADISKVNLHDKFRCRNCEQLFSIDVRNLKIVENSFNQMENSNSITVKDNNDNLNHSTRNKNKKKANKFLFRYKFNIVLVCIMILSVLGTFLVTDYMLQGSAEKQVTSNAHLLLATIEASRSFTVKILKPVLYNALPGRFIVEGMSSSFGARKLFEGIRKMYPEYYFKHASQNPRNKINLADKFESEVIENHFKPNPHLKEWQGYRDIQGRKEFVIMKPVTAKKRCMKCHSVPEKAPIELIEKYGDKAGFGFIIGDVIGALTISVPASEIFEKNRNVCIYINLIIFVCFVILIVIINLFFQNIVVNPLQRLSELVNDISTGKVNQRVEAAGIDEISNIAKGFERMRNSVNMAMSKIKKK